MARNVARGWRLRAFKDYWKFFPARENKPDFVIIPTAGSSGPDHSLPDKDGQNRILRGVQAMGTHKVHGAIIGYYPDAQDKPLSKKYKEWVASMDPRSEELIVLEGGTGNSTIRDIISVAPELATLVPLGGTIAFISDWWHARRVAPLLYSMGYKMVWLKCQDKITRDKFKELLLFLACWIDPRWEGELGKKLGALAQKEADAYRASTRPPKSQDAARI